MHERNHNAIIKLKDRYDVCQHNKFLLDEKLGYVECALCGEKLNPMWVILQFCNDEARLWNQRQAIKKQVEESEKKIRCKCEHCQKMTRIIR